MATQLHSVLLLLSIIGVSLADLTFSIKEEIRDETRVGDVNDAEELKGYPAGANLQFRINTVPAANLTIGKSSGVITTAGRIDREVLPDCAGAEKCAFDFLVHILHESRNLVVVKVTVEVEDINDQVPRFAEDSVKFALLETEKKGKSLKLPTAVDNDSPSFGVQRYELDPAEPDSSYFTLMEYKDGYGSLGAKLELLEPLDREKQSSYRVKVRAYDSAQPVANSDELEVIVDVADVNDNDPVWQNSSYRVSVPEDIAVDSLVVTVKAHDADDGIFGQVSYGFSPLTLDKAGKLFSINNRTGEIRTRALLDYETTSIYYLTVTARDQGPSALPAETTVVITLSDVNDETPVIKVSSFDKDDVQAVSVLEEQPNDTFVAHVRVEDRDSGPSGKVTCSLNDSHFRLVPKQPGSYQIVTARVLDRETFDKFNLVLVCRDHGSPRQQQALRYLEVKVTDVNDWTPVCRQQIYTVHIEENNDRGAVITTVSAGDNDEGENSRITYSIEPSDAVQIDADGGRITALRAFDREKEDQLKLRVKVSDNGEPARTNDCQVEVIIDDVNDNPPVFSEQLYSFSVWENEPENTQIGVIKAIDADNYPNNVFTYSLLGNPELHKYFRVDPERGSVEALRSLDREQRESYQLVVMATDTNKPRLSSSTTISIRVADKNDNAPVIENANQTITVAASVPPGYVVTRVLSSDRDLGDGKKLVHTILHGNEEQLFDMDPHSGLLSVRQPLMTDKEAPRDRFFVLTVLVKDHGTPSLEREITLTIAVNSTLLYKPVSRAHPALFGQNLIILIVVSSLSTVIVIVLVTAIVVIRRQNNMAARRASLKLLQHLPGSDEALSEVKVSADKMAAPRVQPYATQVPNAASLQVLHCSSGQSQEPHRKPPQSIRFVNAPRKPGEVTSHAGLPPPRNSVNGMPSEMTSHPGVLRATAANGVPAKPRQQVRWPPEHDDVSLPSGDSHTTDSGRGASEEGERGAHRSQLEWRYHSFDGCAGEVQI